MHFFRFPFEHFRFGNGHDGAEYALKVAELIFGVTLDYQFRRRFGNRFIHH
jgi:hypothetical protein